VIVCVNQPDAWGVFVSEVIAVAVRGDDGGPGLGLAERMRTMVTWGIGLALAGVLAGYGQSASAGLVAGRSWGKAVEVPGLAALDKGHYVQVESVSCGSAGNCAAGGFYHDRAFHQQGFVALERNGRWGQAIEVPGLGALNQGGFAEVGSVSCGPAGSCAAGGIYQDRQGSGQGFVVSEKNGRWDKAIEVPGLGALNQAGNARVYSVSCGSPGNCAAGGNYTSGGHQQGFVADERNGRWGRAIEVPGLSVQHASSRVESVSCASAGNCAAAGYDLGQGFVASERNGRWGQATEVPGLNALNKGRLARVYSVSCGSPGNCAAGGNYTDASSEPKQHGFATVEQNGRWTSAVQMPGPKPLAKGQYYAAVASVSCTRAGPCAAAGYFLGGGRIEAGGFVVSEKDGRWTKAIEVPSLGPPAKGNQIFTMSCATPGNCAAGGSYLDSGDIAHAFVVSEKNGHWANPIKVPGLAALADKQDYGQVFSVSCAAPGNCTAGGFYASNAQRGFVTQSR
jgi:hypothetical protein